VLQGRPLYRVNSLVDAMNLCSLTTLVPFGVYDRARIVAPVMLRFGSVGEGYEGIGRGRVGVEGKPVLVDRDGPFGNPTADSLRTSVGHGTTMALVVLYLPPTVDAAHVDRFLGAASAAVVRACGGAETGRRVVR
jgi:DNA/RNA-binding domain of Phe-tRNA-synthetase-like protein